MLRSVPSYKGRDAANEIGVISGVSKVLVPVEIGVPGRNSRTEQIDFELKAELRTLHRRKKRCQQANHNLNQ
jgi:hypothetical protein